MISLERDVFNRLMLVADFRGRSFRAWFKPWARPYCYPYIGIWCLGIGPFGFSYFPKGGAK